jgi:hypothetical protein
LSRIHELGDPESSDHKIKFANLPAMLEQYERELAEAEQHLAIKGKKLEHANRENPTWQHYYDARRIELATLVKYMEMQVARVRGKLFKSYSEHNQRDFSDKAKNQMIDNEPAYLNVYELYLEVEEMYKKYQAVVDAFTSRGYALNNITKIRVAALEDAMV